MFNFKKIFLSFICLFCFFGFANIVKASEITMFQECEYKRSYGTLKGKHGEAGKNIYIGYTQLYAASGSTFEIQARLNRTDEFEHLGDIEKYFGFNVDHNSSSVVTFGAAVNGNSGACPKYMTIEVDSGKDHKALFYNDLSQSTECNSDPSERCKAYFSLVSTISNVKVDPNEIEWSRTNVVNGNPKICTDLTIKLSIKENRLYGIGNYGRNSLYMDVKNEWTSPKVLQNVEFDDIYELATTNSMTTRIAFNPDEGKGDTYISMSRDIGWFDDYCNVYSAFSKGYTCATSSSLNGYLSGIEIEINKAYPDISSTYNEYSRYPGSGDRVAITYSASNDKDRLKNVISGISTAIEGISVSEDSINEIKNKLNGVSGGTYLSSGLAPCQDAKTRAQNAFNNLKSKGDVFGKQLAVINETLNNASTRLKKIETDEAEKQKYMEMANQATEMIEEKSQIVTIVNDTILDGMSFSFSDLSFSDGACGVLSYDMKEFIDLILWYIKIAGIVLAIILSLTDYIKAASGSDEKSMANANKRVLMRIVFVAILFLVPALLEFVLGTLNISTTAGSLKCLK